MDLIERATMRFAECDNIDLFGADETNLIFNMVEMQAPESKH